VHVLEEQRVAGYDPVVLEADSASALKDWLAGHGYATRPDLAAWLGPYVKAGWKITAFKIARDATRQEIATSAVRMSFATDRPFFPYSEPADQRDAERQGGGGRLLRVFFVADSRYAGRLGDAEPWAGPLDAAAGQGLADRLNLAITVWPRWLTVFEDRASPRAGTADVSFVPSASQEEVRPAPVRVRVTHDLSGWVCLVVALLAVFGPVLLAIRRARRPSRPAALGGE
jgi:hypothetical protein